MPVMITGAESGAGRAVARALLSTGGEVRAYLDAERCGEDDAAAWRRAGCKVALGTLDDEGHLESALEQAHTVVHLAGGPLAETQAQLDELATVMSAAVGAGCRRFIWPTELAALTAGENPYLQQQREAADLLDELPMEVVTMRCALRYGVADALTVALAGGLASAADPAARHAPLHLDDLADAVVAADSQRGSRGELHFAIELVGPNVVPLGGFVERLRAVLAPSGASTPPRWLADWLSRSAVGGPEALGRQGTRIVEGLARLAAAEVWPERE